MDNYHVNKTEAGWELIKQGASRASKTAPTKTEILKTAAAFFEGKTASLKVHTQNGRIEEERTYPRSVDPAKSKG